MSFIKKILTILKESDIRFLIHERYSLIIGGISILFAKLLYKNRFAIKSNYRVWGKIRFLLLGSGSITIGKEFHCVSNRKRSVFTLFTPTHITIIGNGKIVLGDHVGLNGTTIASRAQITIGDNTMIGPNTVIIDHDGHVAWPLEDRWIKQGPIKEIVIENDVWIGMNCMILKGVTIGSGAIIAAGSVVVGNVESNSVYAGNPAKKIKSLV